MAEKKKRDKRKKIHQIRILKHKGKTQRKESGAKKANTTKKLENTKNNEKDNDEENIKGEEKTRSWGQNL